MTTQRKIETDLKAAIDYIIARYQRYANDDLDGSIYSKYHDQIFSISLVFLTSPLLVHVEKAQKELLSIRPTFQVFGGSLAPLASINGQGGN